MLLLTPADEIDTFNYFDFPGVDKIVHLTSFMVLEILSLKYFFSSHLKSAFIVIAITILYGVFIEIIQIYVPGRSFEWWDIVADFAGIILGYFVISFTSSRNDSKILVKEDKDS